MQRPVDGLLEYDPRQAADVRYAVAFSIFKFAYASILVGTLQEIDLVDLNEVVWDDYQRVGYDRFWITRTDGKRLSRREVNRLESAVRDDFSFDCTEEGDLWLNISECTEKELHSDLPIGPKPRCLMVQVIELAGDDGDADE